MPKAFVAQTSIRDTLAQAYAGMLATSCPSHVVHGVNTSRQTVAVTVTADNAQVYTVTIVQFGASVSYQFTSDADATQAEIVDGLVAAINAGSQAVTAVDGGNSFTLVADYAAAEYAFTASGSAGGSGALTFSTTIAQAAPLADGVLCIFDSSVSSEPMAVRLPTAAGDITGHVGVAGIKLADGITKVRTANADSAPSMVGLVRKGHVYVQVEEECADNSVVYVRYAAGGNGLGSFGASAGTSERAVLNGAVYRKGAAAGGFAMVELNLIGG